MGFISFLIQSNSDSPSESSHLIAATSPQSTIYNFSKQGLKISLCYALISILSKEGLEFAKQKPVTWLTFENLVMVGAIVVAITLFSFGLGVWAAFLDKRYPDNDDGNVPRKIFNCMLWTISLLAHLYKGPIHFLGLDRLDSSICKAKDNKSQYENYSSMKTVSQPTLLDLEQQNSTLDQVNPSNSAPILYHGYFKSIDNQNMPLSPLGNRARAILFL